MIVGDLVLITPVKHQVLVVFEVRLVRFRVVHPSEFIMRHVVILVFNHNLLRLLWLGYRLVHGLGS